MNTIDYNQTQPTQPTAPIGPTATAPSADSVKSVQSAPSCLSDPIINNESDDDLSPQSEIKNPKSESLWSLSLPTKPSQPGASNPSTSSPSLPIIANTFPPLPTTRTAPWKNSSPPSSATANSQPRC